VNAFKKTVKLISYSSRQVVLFSPVLSFRALPSNASAHSLQQTYKNWQDWDHLCFVHRKVVSVLSVLKYY